MTTHGNRLGFFIWVGAEAFHLHNRYLLFGEVLDFFHEAFFIERHQAHGFATRSCATRAANAVHIVFADVGNFVVHDMGQFVNIDTACCNVSSNQGADVTTLETSQGLGASRLAFVAVQGHGIDTVFGEVLGHIVGAKLGACEHQYLAPVVFVDDVREQGFLFATSHGVHDLFDALHRSVARGDLDALWVFQ